MPRKFDWDIQVGRRLRLRDLQVLSTVAERGSMAKAAAHLGVSTPTISEVIANLEHGLGVRLFDRSPQGVEPTKYGHALLKRIVIVFDELKQGIKDIECLADPTWGEVRVASQVSFAATILPEVVQRFTQEHPRAVVYEDDVIIFSALVSGLRERKYDLALIRLDRPLTGEEDDLNVEVLFNDRVVLAAGTHTQWARRRKIDLAELVDEPWIHSAPDTWNSARLAEAFQARGLPMPRANLVSLSVPIRAHMLVHGPYIASIALAALRLYTEHYPITVLPVDLPDQTTPIGLVTLKNRTTSPVVERFIERVRNFTRPMRESRRAAGR